LTQFTPVPTKSAISELYRRADGTGWKTRSEKTTLGSTEINVSGRREKVGGPLQENDQIANYADLSEELGQHRGLKVFRPHK